MITWANKLKNASNHKHEILIKK